MDANDLTSGVLSDDGGRARPGPRAEQQELVSKLQAAGYSQIGEGKSTPEGITVKAMKDGKEVHLVVDSSGQIKQQH